MFNGYKKDIAAAAPKIEELQEGYPTEGSPSLGIPATQPGAAWFHMITTELLNVIKELGVLPDKNSLNQLATAILTLKFPTGTAFEYLRDKNYSKMTLSLPTNVYISVWQIMVLPHQLLSQVLTILSGKNSS